MFHTLHQLQGADKAAPAGHAGSACPPPYSRSRGARVHPPRSASGRFIVYPSMGCRFIALNDGVDTIHKNNEMLEKSGDLLRGPRLFRNRRKNIWLELRQGRKMSKSSGWDYGPRMESASGADAYTECEHHREDCWYCKPPVHFIRTFFVHSKNDCPNSNRYGCKYSNSINFSDLI
mgnify:CR=1 FL=1